MNTIPNEYYRYQDVEFTHDEALEQRAAELRQLDKRIEELKEERLLLRLSPLKKTGLRMVRCSKEDAEFEMAWTNIPHRFSKSEKKDQIRT
jgi:hypothetical protein